MKNKKWMAALLLIILCSMAGCRKGTKEAEKPAIIPVVTDTPVPEEEPEAAGTKAPAGTPGNHEGKAESVLTGEWIDQEKAGRRPYAIMFNNIKIASPQCGTSQAAIMYEALSEGGITRLMGIFEDFDADRIGSVRSARHYFVSIADEYDAIYVHFGQSKYALNKIKEIGINNLNGLEGVGNTVYYRDNSIKAPHNAFASWKSILKGTEQKKYRTGYQDTPDNHFRFYEEDTELKTGLDAEKVTLKFSGYTAPYFEYNEKNKLYYRYQFNEKHIDKNTGKQLAFKNLIVQYVKQWTIDKKNGYQSMDIENSSGTGYYITNGRSVPITWKKNEARKEMHYYDENGDVLAINPGKTYIAVFPDNNTKDVVISDKK